MGRGGVKEEYSREGAVAAWPPPLSDLAKGRPPPQLDHLLAYPATSSCAAARRLARPVAVYSPHTAGHRFPSPPTAGRRHREREREIEGIGSIEIFAKCQLYKPHGL